MRILLSAAGPLDGQFGGGQVYVQNLARELYRRGCDVTVLCADPWPGRDHTSQVLRRNWNGIPVVGVAVNPAAARAGERWTERHELLQQVLNHVLDDLRPDFIHLNGLKPVLTALANQRSLPHVVTAHHGGVACPAGALLRYNDALCDRPMDGRACASCYCRQLEGGSGVAGRVLSTVPAWAYRPIGRALNVLPNPTYAGRVMMYPWVVERAIDGKRSAIRTAQRWIAPSRAMADVLVRNGAIRARVNIVPHGIEPLRRTPIEGLGSRPVRFGYVGQIHRAKGVHVLLEAFSKLPAGLAELYIVGQPQRPGQQAYLDNAMRPLAGRRDVFMRGAVPHDQIGQVMSDLDVLVLPTICLEVFGLVVLEAFSAGRPVIVTQCGGPEETVRHGVDGLVIPRNDATALAAAMRHLAANPARIAELAAGIRPVRTLVEHVDELEAIYHGLARSKDAQPKLSGTQTA